MLTEFARWMITDEYGRRRPSVCRMTEDEAKALCPDAEKIPQTSEWRDLYPPDEAKYKHSISYRGEWDGKPGPTVGAQSETPPVGAGGVSDGSTQAALDGGIESGDMA